MTEIQKVLQHQKRKNMLSSGILLFILTAIYVFFGVFVMNNPIKWGSLVAVVAGEAIMLFVILRLMYKTSFLMAKQSEYLVKNKVNIDKKYEDQYGNGVIKRIECPLINGFYLLPTDEGYSRIHQHCTYTTEREAIEDGLVHVSVLDEWEERKR